jgi:hypothetical protein
MLVEGAGGLLGVVVPPPETPVTPGLKKLSNSSKLLLMSTSLIPVDFTIKTSSLR